MRLALTFLIGAVVAASLTATQWMQAQRMRRFRDSRRDASRRQFATPASAEIPR